MTIQVGERLPDVPLAIATPEGPKPTTSGEYFAGKRVALFAVPGAFTPTCSARHLPSYVDKARELKSQGIDEIACISVNDPFVMGAWGERDGSEDIVMLADGNGDFAEAVGLEMDGAKFGMGKRSPALLDDRQRRGRRAAECRGSGRISRVERGIYARPTGDRLTALPQARLSSPLGRNGERFQ